MGKDAVVKKINDKGKVEGIMERGSGFILGGNSKPLDR